MTDCPRWAAPLPARAAACRIRLPWERGLRRSAFAVRRSRPAARTPDGLSRVA